VPVGAQISAYALVSRICGLVLELAERCARGPSPLDRLLAPRTSRASGCRGSNGGVRIVLDAPLFDLEPRIVERNENVFIQAFRAQMRIETLDVRVLDRLAPFESRLL
jgi:hypothetical protein